MRVSLLIHASIYNLYIIIVVREHIITDDNPSYNVHTVSGINNIHVIILLENP